MIGSAYERVYTVALQIELHGSMNKYSFDIDITTTLCELKTFDQIWISQAPG